MKVRAPKGSRLKIQSKQVERLEIECPDTKRRFAFEFVQKHGFRVTNSQAKVVRGRVSHTYQVVAEKDVSGLCKLESSTTNKPL